MHKKMIVSMPDGSQWAVPVDAIARNRAEYYAAREFDGDVERSLNEDTLPLFESGSYEIEDWAANNMNWSDVADQAECWQQPECDYQEGWCNGEKSFD